MSDTRPGAFAPERSITNAQVHEAIRAYDTFVQMMKDGPAKHPGEVIDGKGWEEAQRLVAEHPDLFFKAVISGYWQGLWDNESIDVPPKSTSSKTAPGAMYQ